MIVQRPIFHYALLSLEALTAHGIHSGEQGATHDVSLLRDVNGLPALPGSSLAGVLRHLFQAYYQQAATEQLFGHSDGSEGQPSWVQFGWGLVHDSKNVPTEGIRDTIEDDAVLTLLSQPHPLVRQRVRLNARGAAAETGKFDVSLVPAGTRYSLFMSYWSDGTTDAESHWRQLLGLLGHPACRLGHGIRSGAGAFKVIDLRTTSWDLRTPEGRQGYQTRPRTRLAGRTLPACTLDLPPIATPLSVSLDLQAEAGWRVGGGDDALGLDSDRRPDLLPLSESSICWNDQQGSLGQRRALLPATAIKGALAHRVAYHYRCLTGEWVSSETAPVEADGCPAVKALFGTASDTDTSGAAGRIVINDLIFDSSTIYTQMHNRIDRFTGGVINGALFEEALLWKTPVQLHLTLLDLPGQAAISTQVKQALQRTLQDLADGWLPLGAGGSRGHGVFTAAAGPCWSDKGTWLTQTDHAEAQS